MQPILSAKDFSLTPAIKTYVLERLQVLVHHAPAIEDVKVELDVDHNQHKGLINRVEISARLGTAYLKAGEKAEHMREAIDLCIPKLIRQIEKHKTTLQHRRGV